MITTKCAICGIKLEIADKWDGYDEDEKQGRIVCKNHSNEELIEFNKKKR